MRSLAALVCVAALLVGRPLRAQESLPVVHVTHVEGPLTRHALRMLVTPGAVRECQSTFMGGPMRLRIHVETSGAFVIDELSANEEIGVYARCVRRVIGALRAGPRSDVTRALVTIEFPSLGLGSPRPP